MSVAQELADPADYAVRHRIRTRLSETLFVEAGAGSGKTTVLVDRLLELFLVHGVQPRQVAAITFTEAAATELRDRVREQLERRSPGPHHRERCEAALADLDRAAITTLHGFALRILTEHATAAGLPPQVRVLDEVSSELEHEERWEHFVDALYDDDRNDELLVRASVLKVHLEARYRGQATLAQAASMLAQSWDRLAPVAGEQHPPLGAIDFGPFDRAVADLASLVVHCRDESDVLFTKLIEPLDAAQRIVQVDDPIAKLELLATPAWNRGGGKAANWSPSCRPDDVKAAITAVQGAAERVQGSAADDVIRRLVTLVASDLLAAAEQRRLEGALEFHDLLVLARRLLRTSSRSRQSLHERYRFLLLDEFQDTDPLQIELATLIAGSIADDPGEWGDIDVEGGRLFFVGDPKQSIYRFRRADIELFLSARDRFGDTADPVGLTSNFRTVAPVVAWLNELFSSVMAEEVEKKQPRYVPLHAERAASEAGEHRPLLLGGPLDMLAPEVRAREAGDVARVIGDIARHPDRWPVDDDAGGWRDARLSDVTVLVPTRTSLPYLLPELDAAGVPYRIDTGSLVFATQEISDVLAAVRAIVDTTDQISLVAALRSPLYACSDVDLLTYHQAGGRFDLTAELPASLDGHAVVAAMSDLKGRWQERSWIGPATLVERIVRERQAMLAAFGAARPREVWRRLRFLIDQARAFEDLGERDLRRFVEWAELQRSEGARVHEPLLRETDEDSVRVMTVHGAKGLEFPITIVSGMTTARTKSRSGAQVLWHETSGCEVKLAGTAMTQDFDRRADIEEEMDVHEKRRLLYVALTRARDHLVVSAFHGTKRGAGSHGELIWQECQQFPDLWRHIDDVLPASAGGAGVAADLTTPAAAAIDLAAAEDQRRSWVEQRDRLRAANAQPATVAATAVWSTPFAASGAGAADDETDLDDVEAEQAGADGGEAQRRWRRGRAGSAIGRAVHATLQSLDLAIDPDHPDVATVARREAELEVIVDLAEQVATSVRAVLRSDAVALARVYPHHKEMFVAAPVGGRTIEGYIDLLVEGPDGLVIVDYKTDSVRTDAEVDAKLDRYEMQGAAYVLALEQATGQRVAECRFVFCRASGAIERKVGDLDAAKRRVLDALAG